VALILRLPSFLLTVHAVLNAQCSHLLHRWKVSRFDHAANSGVFGLMGGHLVCQEGGFPPPGSWDARHKFPFLDWVLEELKAKHAIMT
jgi:hypothetical protein